MNELPRHVKIRPLPGTMRIEANEAERNVLAKRFGIGEVRSLLADVELKTRANSIAATGSLTGEIVQDCSISGEPFTTRIAEGIDLRFVEALEEGKPVEDDVLEVDLDINEGDEIEYSGDSFDLGEAIAQTLGLAIDPYAEGPNAERVRAENELLAPATSGAFAGLGDLLKK